MKYNTPLFRTWAILLLCAFTVLQVEAQDIDSYNPSWYNPDQPYVKVGVAQNGVYRFTGSDLTALGVPTSGIDPATLQLFYKGSEVPIYYVGNAAQITPETEILFVGERNTGKDENWAYTYNQDWQSSTYYSLYSDTTYYWLTWGNRAGRRYTLTDPGTGNLTENVTSFRDTVRVEGDNFYYAGDTKPEQRNPRYTRGEGWYLRRIAHTNGDTSPVTESGINPSLTNFVRSATEPVKIKMAFNGITPTAHRLDINVQSRMNGTTDFRTAGTLDWTGYAFQQFETTLSHDQIASSRLRLEFTSYNVDGAFSNLIDVDWVEVVYTRELSASGDFLRFGFVTPGSRNFTIEDVTGEEVYIFFPRSRRVFEPTPQAETVTFSDQAAVPGTYWFATEETILSPANLWLDTSSNLASTSNQADYLIITTEALRSSAEAYADYRRAQSGYNVMVVDVIDIFDQFDFGRPTPQAIRRFVHQTASWDLVPEFLLFWGDTKYPDRTIPREVWDVPSYGSEGSGDGWFGMQQESLDDWTEMIAIGRIPIRDNATGELFLQKTMTYEGVTLEDWQKRFMALVGGSDRNEQLSLQSLVLPWSNQAAAAPTGMDTLQFFSNTDNPFGIEEAFQDSLRKALIDGAAWLTYFGHSATSTWDIVTDNPEDFNNATRLPIAISLGCQTGAFGGGAAIGENALVLGERLVIGSLNGSIGHWGSSGLGSVSASARMGTSLHDVVFSDTMRVAGKIFQEVKRQYATSDNFSIRDLIQYSYLGDPATIVNIPTKPDFELTSSHIRVTPAAPIPADSVMTVTVQLENQGLVPQDSIGVRLMHAAPTGETTTYAKNVAPFRLETNVVFEVPITETLAGDNLFEVQVDPDNAFNEVDETNNSAERTHVVFSSQIILVAPNNLGTVPNEGTIRFRVNYVNQDPETTNARFQLDTSPTFDSPALQEYSTPAAGSFAAWTLDTPLSSGQTYYWRSGLETAGEPINWREAAFTVQDPNNQHPWLQEGDLFQRNTLSETLTRTDGEWDLGQYPVHIQYSSESGSGEYKGQFLVNGARFEDVTLGFGVLLIDGLTGAYKGSISAALYENTQNLDPVAERARLDSLVSVMEEDDYVFIRTRHVGRSGSVEISDDVKDVFRSLGSTAIDTLDYNDLWLMRTRVGHPEETLETVPTGTNEALLEETLFFNAPEGQLLTPPIGPAQAWETLTWEAELPNEASEVIIDVLSANSNNVLLGDLTNSPADISSIASEEYPLIRLRATLRDTTRQADPQLISWSVDYRTVPEIIVDQSSLVLSADTLNELEPLTLTAKLLNLSDTPADSVIVTLDLTDASNTTSTVAADTLLNLAGDSEASVSFDIETTGLLGDNQLTLEARLPGLSEALTFNNIAITNFTVRGDQVPPTLRVTVDGTEYPADPNPIQNLQDPNIPQLPVQPTIEVVFSDENPFRLLTDTTLAVITLDGDRIPFSSPDVQFEAATESKNEARIIYTPDFTGENAVHTLVVTAFDVNGNEAEGSPYQFHFRIATTFEVGNVYPYPNPMSSFTRFAFQVQGANTTLIDDFRIRIYTLSGRVVQEFDLVDDPSGLDGSQLRIGWNKLTWDGTDADGDLLAPGVYLYKVYLKVEGQEVTVNNETGIEKLVIVR